MIYLILSNLGLVLFFSIYQLTLNQLTFFNLNRWYLLGSVALAFAIPLVLFSENQIIDVPVIYLPEINLGSSNSTELGEIYAKTTLLNAFDWLVFGYWLGVLVSMITLVFKFYFLYQKKKAIHALESYSFFGKVRLGSLVKDNEIINSHENIHIKLGHSYDLLFLELVQVFNWFNPIIYFLKRALKFQHECSVDSCFSNIKVQYAELLLAHALQVDRSVLRHDFSKKSILKQRIKMLFKKQSKSWAKYSYFIILPISFLILTLILNCKGDFEQEVDQNLNITTHSILDTQFVNIQNHHDSVFAFEDVEVVAEYPGGINNFRKFLNAKFEYTQEAIDKGAKGTIEVSFVINKKGETQDFKILRDLGYGLGESVIKTIKQTQLWNPARKNGESVAVRYTLPIRLDLSPM